MMLLFMKSNISRRKILVIKILIMKFLLCLIFSDVDARIIEENENKYLIFALTKNNKKVLETYKKHWSKIKKQIQCNSIEAINSSECSFIKLIKYEKDPMKNRFDSYDDDLPFNKILCFSVLDIIVESVFQIKDKYHPQIHIHECEYKEYEQHLFIS